MNILKLIGRTNGLVDTDIKKYELELKVIIQESSFLVIGGAGSIGQAVTKEIFKRNPKKLHIVDISENNMVELVRDLRSSYGYIDGDFQTFALDIGSIEYDAFIKAFVPLNEKISKAYQAANAAPNGVKKDSLAKIFETQKNGLKTYITNFLNTKPTSAVSSFVLLQFYPIFGNEIYLEKTYKKLNGDAKKGLFAQLIEQKITVFKTPKFGDIGTVPPNFEQPDSSGKMIKVINMMSFIIKRIN